MDPAVLPMPEVPSSKALSSPRESATQALRGPVFVVEIRMHTFGASCRPPTVTPPANVVSNGRFKLGFCAQVASCTILKGAGIVWTVLVVQGEVVMSVIDVSAKLLVPSEVVGLHTTFVVDRSWGRSETLVPGWHEPPFGNSCT